jgi:hypothetical protein
VVRSEGGPEKICEVLRPLLSHPDFLKPILEKGDFCIVRCAHLDLDTAKKVLGERGIKVLGVSGTLRKAKRKYLSEAH